jgi:hypothetical protein
VATLTRRLEIPNRIAFHGAGRLERARHPLDRKSQNQHPKEYLSEITAHQITLAHGKMTQSHDMGRKDFGAISVPSYAKCAVEAPALCSRAYAKIDT